MSLNQFINILEKEKANKLHIFLCVCVCVCVCVCAFIDSGVGLVE